MIYGLFVEGHLYENFYGEEPGVRVRAEQVRDALIENNPELTPDNCEIRERDIEAVISGDGTEGE